MSEFSSVGLNMSVSGRLFGLNDNFRATLQDEVDTYSHTIQAAGGYWDASATIIDSKQHIEAWLANGLGRHVVVHDHSLDVIWEGFVNEVLGNFGAVSIRHGPLTEAANRVIAYYSDSASSAQAVTAVANDVQAQDMYGIWYKVLSESIKSAASAEYARDTFLTENAWPRMSKDLNDSGTDQSVVLNCVGYRALLDYPYLQVGTSWNLYEKVQDIVASEPNSVFSTDYSHIERNTISVPKKESERISGTELMKAQAELGGPADSYRRLWGIYKNRIMHYAPVPSIVDYQMNVLEGRSSIRTIASIEVKPWNVLPGKWIQFTDLLPDEPSSDNLWRDPRMSFIETVQYSSKYGLSFAGGRTDKLPQIIARLNMLKGV